MQDPNDLPDLDLPEDAAAELSFAEIYDKLLLEDELIVAIPAEVEETLRKGLAGHKYKLNEKLKKQGLPADTATLSFRVSPHDSIEGAINVHIILSKKAAVKVYGIFKPDNEL